MYVQRATEGRTAKLSQNKTHFTYCLHCFRETTVWSAQNKKTIASLGDRYLRRQIRSFGQQVCTSESNRPRPDNKFARANHIDPSGQQVRTSESDRPLWTTSPYKQIISTRLDNKFARANQINYFGQQVCTSESDRPFWTTSPYKPIRSLQIAWTVIELLILVAFFEVPKDRTIIKLLIAVIFFEVPKYRTVIKQLIAVTFFEVPEDRTVIGPLYTVPFLGVQKRSSHCTIPDRTSDGPRRPSFKDQVIARSQIARTDGQNLKKKSLYAQKPYFVRISRFERISFLRAKVVLPRTQ